MNHMDQPTADDVILDLLVDGVEPTHENLLVAIEAYPQHRDALVAFFANLAVQTALNEEAGMRCQHEPKALYQIDGTNLVSVVLAPHRARDWVVCEKCGYVGLASRNTKRIHWRGLDAELVASAQRWNAWSKKQAAETLKQT